MTEFTLIEALIGGSLIAIASVTLLLLNGKIAGISGIFYNSLAGIFARPVAKSVASTEKWWRLLFILGLILSPVIAILFNAELPQNIDIGWPTLIAGGFFVGLGSRLGSGCTSGHGICGIGRFSVRSVIATCVFMATAVVTVFLVKHIL